MICIKKIDMADTVFVINKMDILVKVQNLK